MKDGDRRKNLYWLFSACATLSYLLILTSLMLVPGSDPATNRVLLTFAAFMLALSLLVGIWRFGTTDAPITSGQFGIFVGVIVILQLGLCVTQLIAQLVALRNH